MKHIIQYILCLMLLITFLGCSSSDGGGGGDDPSTTRVEIRMIDTTGIINPEQSYIMSIYDPSNDADFRYSQYSTDRTVVFKDVEPGNYRAHVTSAWVLGQSAVDLTVEEGDDILIVFTYYRWGSVPVDIGPAIVYQDIYKWKYELTRK